MHTHTLQWCCVVLCSWMNSTFKSKHKHKHEDEHSCGSKVETQTHVFIRSQTAVPSSHLYTCFSFWSHSVTYPNTTLEKLVRFPILSFSIRERNKKEKSTFVIPKTKVLTVESSFFFLPPLLPCKNPLIFSNAHTTKAN